MYAYIYVSNYELFQDPVLNILSFLTYSYTPYWLPATNDPDPKKMKGTIVSAFKEFNVWNGISVNIGRGVIRSI